MKKLIFPFIVMACLYLASGCSTKFNVAAPYKNITIVYGFLDAADTAHYIRIQKAFMDQNKSAITMAQNADSNFYSTLNVWIERRDFTGNLHDTIQLSRVNLTLEGYPKATGVFFNTPNYAYKFTKSLDPNYIYRIKVLNPATGEVDSSDAPIIDDRTSLTFFVAQIDDTSINRAGLDFSNSSINKFFQVYGNYYPVANFNFQGQQTGPAYVAQAVITFNWLDSNMLDHSKTPRSYDYNLGYQVLVSNQFDYSINHQDLYSAVAAAMTPAPASTARLIGRCGVAVYLSTYDYSLYQQSSQIQGTGLTGTEIEPVVTNVKGANALGLFTSKGVRSGLLTITINTIDSLMQNPLTQPANIRGTAY